MKEFLIAIGITLSILWSISLPVLIMGNNVSVKCTSKKPFEVNNKIYYCTELKKEQTK
jgi:hypothetical protein